MIANEKRTRKDVTDAITMQKETLIFLEKDETRALAETDQTLKSQYADVRFDLLKSLLILGRKDDALKVAEELADVATTSLYADWIKDPQIDNDPQFQQVLQRIRSVKESAALKGAYKANISEAEKIAGLSLFWANAKFSFVYFDQVPDLDWDKVFLEYLTKVRDTRSTYEYYRVLREMCALLKDGHTNVNFPKAVSDEMAVSPPLQTLFVEDKVIVWRVFSDTITKQGIIPGVEVVKIDGIPVREYAEKNVRRFQSASTPQDLLVRTYSYALLAGPRDKPIEFELKSAAGELFKRTVPRSGYSDAKTNIQPFEFRVLDGNVGYIALNTFENNAVISEYVKNFDAISKTGSLIIDLRENGGGNSDLGEQILSTLIDKPFFTSRESSREYRGLRKARGVEVEWITENTRIVQPSKTRSYSKPIVILTSARTYSAAEDFLVAFDHAKRGKIIGEPTGGSTGQPLFFALPGGGSARICVKRDTYPDGRKFVGIGIKPDIRVDLKVSDLIDQKDSVLERALQDLTMMSSQYYRGSLSGVSKGVSK